MEDDRDLERIERLLRQAASDLEGEYPPTPPIAAAVRRELENRRRRPISPLGGRLIRAAALAAAALALLLLISPDARQAVARFFGLETVRIERIATVPAPTARPPQTAGEGRPTGQPAIQPSPELAGLTTLADAQAKAKFDIRLPAYPPDLGQPQAVYLQQFGFGQQVILVYPDFALFQAEGVIYSKGVGDGAVIEEVKVGGQDALWLSGSPHILLIERPDGSKLESEGRIVDGNVLAWQAGPITYRLETNLPLDEARRIAESLYTSAQPVGLTTLAAARARAQFDVRLPAYPPDLGSPLRVYFQDLDFAQQVILVYSDFALYEAENAIYHKSVDGATVIEEVEVDGRSALWLSGVSHLVEIQNPSGATDFRFLRIVRGNVLAWEGDDVTYRIETALPLDEALRIAESIQSE
jgi:hypothetical protein